MFRCLLLAGVIWMGVAGCDEPGEVPEPAPVPERVPLPRPAPVPEPQAEPEMQPLKP